MNENCLLSRSMAEFDGVIEADKLSSRFPFDEMFVYTY